MQPVSVPEPKVKTARERKKSYRFCKEHDRNYGVDAIVRTTAKVSHVRNQRCACGSGKKYKNCCMKKYFN